MTKKGPRAGSPFYAACHVDNATFTIGAEADNAINVAIQLKTPDGDDLGAQGCVRAYLSDDADGNVITASAPTSVAVGTDGLAVPLVAGKLWELVSEADGDIDLTLTLSSGAATWYLNVILPDGRKVTSGAITFAA